VRSYGLTLYAQRIWDELYPTYNSLNGFNQIFLALIPVQAQQQEVFCRSQIWTYNSCSHTQYLLVRVRIVRKEASLKLVKPSRSNSPAHLDRFISYHTVQGMLPGATWI
jgi:hypothetical protein